MAFKITFSALLSMLFFLFYFSITMGSSGNPTKLPSIESIKQLKGCCDKGRKVQALHHVKLYLARFGYLNYQRTPNQTNTEEENFDDELESALKSYQKYYHLNETGTLDDATISLIVTPRCGLPDKEINDHTSKLLHTVSHYKFFPGKPRWGKSNLTYAFASNYPEKHIPPMVRAFNQWSSIVDYFTFSQVNDIKSADLKASFEEGAHGDRISFDGVVWAHAFAPTDGRIHFNAVRPFSDEPVAVKKVADLESVAVHEIGHLLGLHHSNDYNAAMYAYLDAGVIKGLRFDDKQGIKKLYGIE